jgi:hypothetical protein
LSRFQALIFQEGSMKKLLSVAIFLFAASGSAWAQDEVSPALQVSGNAAMDFSCTSAASQNSIRVFVASSRLPDYLTCVSVERLSSPVALASPAYPAAAAAPASKTPVPKIKDTGRENRWQIGLGVALVRFRSSVYFATAVGLNSSLSYFVKDSLAIEGAVTSAFAPAVFQSFEHVKYVGYGAGPKYVFAHDQLQPWIHALVGGIHILPQTALGSQNGFEVLVGGGADYALNPNWALRLEADYVRTHVFGQSQNSGQAVLGIVHSF